MKTNPTYQKELLGKFKANANEAYTNAPIYTILYDLVDGNGLYDVVTTLHNLAAELGQRSELEELFDKTKEYKWSTEKVNK